MAPNAAEILSQYAPWASTFGEPARGAAVVDRVVRLDPSVPVWAARLYASAYFFARRYEDALGMIDRIEPENYGEWMWALRPSAEAALGRSETAAASVEAALAAFPDLTVQGWVSEPGTSDSERQRMIETMRLAGFPACATPKALAGIEKPVRLPECLARADAGSP
jgi:tetratricopeptide (TPR) repeat protein